jgi:hypothetical protein
VGHRRYGWTTRCNGVLRDLLVARQHRVIADVSHAAPGDTLLAENGAAPT